MHTVFGTECNSFFDWQSLALVYSHRKAGVLGPITRYPPYNKPAAILHWLQSGGLKEEWVLIVDPDMIIRDHFSDWGRLYGAERGWALGVYHDYLQGVYNNLSDWHIPDVPLRWDAIGGPRGRRADQVSSLVLLHKRDLQGLAPLWINYTEGVRQDPLAWNETGDEFAIKKPGTKPWIAEMYGYAFAAAKAGIFHRVDQAAMLYPGQVPIDQPLVLHYGREFTVSGYMFGKHWFHEEFDPFQCPPWPHMKPPGTTNPTWALYRDLLSVQVITTINAALCEHHLLHCPTSEELATECAKAKDLEKAVDMALVHVESSDNEFDPLCFDSEANCAKWAGQGKCAAQPVWMHTVCRMACGLCRLSTGNRRIQPFNWAADPETVLQPRPKLKPKPLVPYPFLPPEEQAQWEEAVAAAREQAAFVTRTVLAQKIAAAAKAAADEVVRSVAEVQKHNTATDRQQSLSLAAEVAAASGNAASAADAGTSTAATGAAGIDSQTSVGEAVRAAAVRSLSDPLPEAGQGVQGQQQEAGQGQPGKQEDEEAADDQELDMLREEKGQIAAGEGGSDGFEGSHDRADGKDTWRKAVAKREQRQQQLSRVDLGLDSVAAQLARLTDQQEQATRLSSMAQQQRQASDVTEAEASPDRAAGGGGVRTLLWGSLAVWCLLAAVVGAARLAATRGYHRVSSGASATLTRVRAKAASMQRQESGVASGEASGAGTPSSATSTSSSASLRQALLLHRASQPGSLTPALEGGDNAV
eukprot:scaffold14.g1114.t1